MSKIVLLVVCTVIHSATDANANPTSEMDTVRLIIEELVDWQ